MRNATKQKIQSAAMQLFVQKGFGSTNVQDIADTAGISIGLLYRHYKSKETLFDELVDYALAGMQKNIDFFEEAVSPKQALDQFVREIHNDMMTGEEFANLLILMAQSFLSGGGTRVKQSEVAQLSDNMFRATAQLIKKVSHLVNSVRGTQTKWSYFSIRHCHDEMDAKKQLHDAFHPHPHFFSIQGRRITGHVYGAQGGSSRTRCKRANVSDF
ncbi:TetR/AcrR family transcriptional regulator [Brevibacillus brevis]|uniref:TetR/AcrR family transcriptional regulator n=1 Tax=Brevibacillus brevis TaxID=1393 RepID=UPI001173F1D1|nr:TetR/AcrR family transcriptional regulator [Brevibacillus brevis]GEC93300.1 hypothetical protein BBR01nite_56310 [Brevibacillus brevis]